MRILLISKSNEYNTLLQNYYRNSGSTVTYTDTIDDIQQLVLDTNPTIVVCDIKFGNIGIVQIKKMVEQVKTHTVFCAVGDCFGNNNLDPLLDSGIEEFLCYNTDLRLSDRRMKSLLGESSIKKEVSDENLLVSDKEHIKVNLAQQTLYQNGKPIPLTKLEFDLVVYFLQNKNTLLTREEIINQIWPEEVDKSNLRKVDSFVKKLRSKLDGLNSLLSIRGQGYRFEESV